MHSAQVIPVRPSAQVEPGSPPLQRASSDQHLNTDRSPLTTFVRITTGTHVLLSHKELCWAQINVNGDRREATEAIELGEGFSLKGAVCDICDWTKGV
eukprot:1536763-Amphidinium_carterae.1